MEVPVLQSMQYLFQKLFQFCKDGRNMKNTQIDVEENMILNQNILVSKHIAIKALHTVVLICLLVQF